MRTQFIENNEAETLKRIVGECKEGAIEIGVLDGASSRTIADGNPEIPVWGIDPLIVDSIESSLIGNAEAIKENTGICKNYEWINDYSYNVVLNWDKPIDFLFIDGSHHYEDVKKDFEMWLPKISKDGMILFHDSTMYRGGPPFHVGPSRFVDELIKDNKEVKFEESQFTITVFRKL